PPPCSRPRSFCAAPSPSPLLVSVFFAAAPTTGLSTLSLHDALPICVSQVHVAGREGDAAQRLRPAHRGSRQCSVRPAAGVHRRQIGRAHVELQSRFDLVCRLLLEKKKKVTSPATNAPEPLSRVTTPQ